MPAASLDVRKLIVWSYNVPAVSVWAVVSFFPVVGQFQKEASTVAVLGELLFLATGLIGVGCVATALSLLVARGSRGRLPNPLKGRPGVLTVYTTIWLGACAALQYGALR